MQLYTVFYTGDLFTHSFTRIYRRKYKDKDSIKQLLVADSIIAHCNVGVEFLARFLTFLLDVGGIYSFRNS